MRKRLGTIAESYAKPVFHGLRSSADRFNLLQDLPAHLALKLRQNELDGAFLSPIDYAKDYSLYSVIPGVGVASEGESFTILLLFRGQRSRISTIAADLRSSSEIVLTTLVMAEKYNTHIQILPLTKSPEDALSSVDAVLLYGDAALPYEDREQKLDIVDEWTDLTSLPYVHGIWAAREESLDKEELEGIRQSAAEGLAALDDLAPADAPDYLHQFDYTLNEEAVSGLSEFFRMAYYHGILKDIPDLKFFPGGDRP